MTAGIPLKPIVIDQGTDQQLPFTYSQPVIVNGQPYFIGPVQQWTPVILTGFTARMQVRKSIDDAVPVLDLSTANGGIVIDGPNGKITPIITAAQSALLSGLYFFEIKVFGGAGNTFSLIKGQYYFSPSTTRASGPA